MRTIRFDPRDRVAEAPGPVARAAPALRAVRPAIVFLSGEPGTPGEAYRVTRAAAAATSAGLASLVLTASSVRGHLDTIARAGVLWIWRAKQDEAVTAALTAARRGGAKVIFDIDDLMIDPRFAEPRFIDGMRTQQQSRELVSGYFAQVRATMLRADCCVASTEELAAHVRTVLPTLVIPNGFDHSVTAAARRALRDRPEDGCLRLGYATGSRTHQRDFAACVDAVARVLRRHPSARLVIFQSAFHGPLLDVQEFTELHGLERQVETRALRPLSELPEELARFDINLAPLETGNPFCEAKSELKYFEAALVNVPTIASPTGPYRRAIQHGTTGLLAATRADWHAGLQRLIDEPELRRRLGEAAHRDVLWTHGPEHRAQLIAEAFDIVRGGRHAAVAFALAARRTNQPRPALAETELIYTADRHSRAEVTVAVTLHDYAGMVIEALNSVAAQTLEDLDLIVIDDGSNDDGLALVTAWASAHAARFGHITVLHQQNAGLPAARNSGFAHAETPWVLTLDADNRLLEACAAACLDVARSCDAAFVYPRLRKFGDESGLLSDGLYDPARLIGANYIDALALISRAAWQAAGGYHAPGGSTGWEDYDFWCRLAELGLRGEMVPGEPLAEYRVHAASMTRTVQPAGDRRLRDGLIQQHPWLRLVAS